MTRRMGSAASQTSRPGAAIKKSRYIDRQLRVERMLQSIKIKLLLLGTSESGKSTLAKQMRIIYEQGFSREDRHTYKLLIHWNVVRFMVYVVKTIERRQLPFTGGPDVLDSATLILKNATFIESGELELTDDMVQVMKHVWSDETVQKCFLDGLVSDEFVTAHFFIEDIDRIAALKYEPTDQDILRSRLQTSGVIQTNFKYKDYDISLIDVGGQKSERRKWIHCFDNVTSVLFTVAMGHFDLISEDNHVNRLQESLQVFQWVHQQQVLQNCSIILLLNQKDVLQKKLPLSKFSVHFPSFSGLETYEDVSGYIRNEFESVAKTSKRELYSHFTNATDTSDTEFAMQACMSTILNCHLRETAMW